MRLRRRRWVGVLLVLAVAGLLWSGWGAGRGRRTTSEDTSRETPLASAAVPVELEGLPELEELAQDGRAPAAVSAAPRKGPLGLGRLEVEVVAQDGGEPVPGVRLSIWDAQGRRVEAPEVSRSKRKPAPLTDDEGKVAYEVRAGTDLRLRVDGTGPTRVDGAELRVPALAPEERRAVRFEVLARPELRWFGRVVDGSTGAPLAGATVAREKEWLGGAPNLEESGADGLIELSMASWVATTEQIELPGYAPVDVLLGRGHAEPERACLVPLMRLASLRVVVRDGGAGQLPEPGYLVVGSNGLFERQMSSVTITTTTTESGYESSFEGLPPWVELVADVKSADRKRRETFCLAPGERRELVVELGAGCRVHGVALSPDSAPLPALEVWCLAAAEGQRRFASGQRERATAHATTDELGRFVLEDVPPGEWWVGPAPEARTSGSLETAHRLSIAPHERERFVTLTCWPGLTIRGHVLGVDGQPAEALVTATRPGASEDEFAAGDGSFVLGPLPLGEWSLTTGLTSSGAPGPSVRCSAGDQDVILRLVEGAELSGILLDERGAPATEASTTLLRVGAAEDLWVSQGDSGGKFGFEGIAPGTCFVFSRDGALVALAGPFTLESGETRDVGELGLQEGGELCVRAAASAATQLRFGFLSTELWLPEPSGFGCHVLPPGPVRVQLVRWGAPGGVEVLAEDEAMVRVGESVWVELGVGGGR